MITVLHKKYEYFCPKCKRMSVINMKNCYIYDHFVVKCNKCEKVLQ